MIKIKAVIFDMDGVITHSMPYHYKAWKQVFCEEKLFVPKVEVYKREGQKGIESVIEIFSAFGKKITHVDAARILQKKELLFQSIARSRFISGSRSFIKGITARGYLAGLVTGTSSHEVKKLLPSKLFNLFDVIVSGDSVKRGKPHPEPYLKALSLLKIQAEDALVIENAPFGILSAKAAGIACFALETSLPKDYLKGADKIFSDFNSLREYFEKSYRHA